MTARKQWVAGLLLVLVLVCTAFSMGAETLKPDQVNTWEEARQFAPALDEMWQGKPQPSYTQRTGFSGLFMEPEEAYETLKAAYEQNGDEGTLQVLENWGMPDIIPSGSPVRHVLTGNREGKMVETIGFSGWGWGEENTLIFVKEGSGWQLIDCVQGGACSLHACGEAGVYLECVSLGHGTGFYSRNVEVYNLLTRQTEAAYTAEGFENWYREDYQTDFEVRVWGGASYAADGLHIFCQKTFSTGIQDAEEMTLRAEKVQVLFYACGEDGSLTEGQ